MNIIAYLVGALTTCFGLLAMAIGAIATDIQLLLGALLVVMGVILMSIGSVIGLLEKLSRRGN